MIATAKFVYDRDLFGANATRRFLLQRAEELVDFVRPPKGLSREEMVLLEAEYLDLKNALSVMFTDTEPRSTLWKLHCFMHRCSQTDTLEDLR
jgi:hypothetical protein